MTARKLLRSIALLLLFLSGELHAQGMSESRWWAGIKTGIDFTLAKPGIRYTVFEQIAPGTASNDKTYDGLFKSKGPLIAFTLDYSFSPSFALTLQPAYQNYSFAYTSQFEWRDTLSNTFQLKNSHVQKLHYLELPLMVKYGYAFGSFRVHVQAGGFYGHLLSANKKMQATEKYISLNSETEVNSFTESFDMKQLYIPSQIGFIGGGGISFDINFFRIMLECNYRYGMNNITNMKNRYSDHRLISGAYDVQDDIKLRNLEIVLHCATPLDYLMHMPGFSAKPAKRRK